MNVSTLDKHCSEAVTSGVRVRARPRFLPQHSGKDGRKWVFGYEIEITNLSEREIHVLQREWVIVDADGHRIDVRGDGLVGVQPRIEAGEMFEYKSFCPLDTAWGTMEGLLHAKCSASGEMFEIRIGRFYLVAEGEHAF